MTAAPAFKCLIEVAELRRGLEAVSRAIPGRSTIPILGHALFEATADGTLRLTGTDLTKSLTIEVSAVEISGSVTIPAKQLKDIVTRFPDGCQVSIEDKGLSVAIKAGRARAKLQALPMSDFSTPIEMGGEAARITMAGKDLAADLDKVVYAISSDQTRFYLCGVLLEIMGSASARVLRYVACDGHRIHRHERRVEISGAAPRAIVPTETVSIIAQVAKGAGEVTLSFDRHRVRLEAGGVTVTSQLVDGTYPDYARAMPPKDKFKASAIVDRADMQRIVEAALAVADDKERGVCLTIGPEGVMVDRLGQLSEVEMSIAAETAAGEGHSLPILAGVNGSYFVEMLKALGGDTIEFRPLEGGAIFGRLQSDQGDGEYTCVMQVRLSGRGV